MFQFNPEDFAKAINNAPEESGAFVDATSVPEVETDAYFLEDGYLSRSKLLRLSAIMAGKEPKEFAGSFEKGRMFDQYFTEREKFDASKYSAWDLLQLYKAEHALNASDDYSFASVVSGSIPKNWQVKKQHAIYRNAFQAGQHSVKMKIKSDFDILTECNTKICIDLKSTTKQTLQDFTKDIIAHQLDLQAALYLDVGKYDRFIFVGVSYLNEHHTQKAMTDIQLRNALTSQSKVFVVELSAKTIQKARERYIKIIDNAIKQNLV